MLRPALELGDLNNWAEAEPEFARAERIFRERGDRRGTEFARLGIIRAEAPRRNLPATSEELQHKLESELFTSDPVLRLFCLTIKADVDGEMQAPALKRDWEEIARLARELGDSKWQYRSMGGLAMAEFYAGDIPGARKDMAAALSGATQIHDAGAQIRDLFAIGNGLVLTKLYADAIPYLDNAIKLSEVTPGASYPFFVHLQKANALAAEGNVKEARHLLDSVLEATRLKKASIYEEGAYIQTALLDQQEGKFPIAISRLDRAIEICRANGFLRNLVDAELALANIYRLQGDLQKAEAMLSQASSHAQANGELYSLPERLSLLAKLQAANGKFVEADRTYDKAAALVDTTVASEPSVLDKTAWINGASEMYTDHFALLVEKLHDTRKAFSVIEQARGRTLSDVLLGGTKRERWAAENERSISRLRLKLMSARDTPEIDRIRDDLLLLEETRWMTPGVSILKARSNSHVTLSQIQEALSSKTTILEYVLSDPRSYCILIDRGGMKIIGLPGKKEIEALATDYLKTVASKQPAVASAKALYAALLTPLDHAARKENLIVIRDGLLHLLPFDSLIDEHSRFVGTESVVSYLPSSGSFYLLAKQTIKEPAFARELFAVGGVPYASAADQLQKLPIVRTAGPAGLSDLPNSQSEVLDAAANFKDGEKTILTGAAATEQAVKETPLDRYRILHFAVHGIADRTRPDRSGLLFLPDRQSQQDGLLQAPEVTEMKLRANLVILSACDTAIGPVEGEEGISTLSRSFLLAGARSVISTLWSLDDNSSLELLRQFYENYRASGSPADALAQAKRQFLKKFGADAKPFYWAAFTFEGVPPSAIFHEVQHQPNHHAKS